MENFWEMNEITNFMTRKLKSGKKNDVNEWMDSFLVNFIIIPVFFFWKNYIKVNLVRKQVDSIAQNPFVWCKCWTEKAAQRVGWISAGNLKMNLVVCTFLMLNSPQRAIKFSAWCSLSGGMVPQKLATFRKLTATAWWKRSEEKRSEKKTVALRAVEPSGKRSQP